MIKRHWLGIGLFVASSAAFSAGVDWNCRTVKDSPYDVKIKINGSADEPNKAVVVLSNPGSKQGNQTIYANAGAKVYLSDREYTYHVPVPKKGEEFQGGKDVLGTKLKNIKYFRVSIDQDDIGGFDGQDESGPFSTPAYHMGWLEARKEPTKKQKNDGKKTGDKLSEEIYCWKPVKK